MKFPSVERAAMPITSARTADEASRAPATARISGMTRSALRTPTVITTAVMLRRSTR